MQPQLELAPAAERLRQIVCSQLPERSPALQCAAFERLRYLAAEAHFTLIDCLALLAAGITVEGLIARMASLVEQRTVVQRYMQPFASDD